MVPGDPATTIAQPRYRFPRVSLGSLASYNYNGGGGPRLRRGEHRPIYDISETGTTVTVVRTRHWI